MNTRNSVIGFIGLGAMGSRMAKRLVDAGFKVLVFDRNRAKAQALSGAGSGRGAKRAGACGGVRRDHVVPVE